MTLSLDYKLALSGSGCISCEDTSALREKRGAISQNTVSRHPKMRTTEVRPAGSAAVGLNPELTGHARHATVRAVVFEIPWETARGWRGQQ